MECDQSYIVVIDFAELMKMHWMRQMQICTEHNEYQQLTSLIGIKINN